MDGHKNYIHPGPSNDVRNGWFFESVGYEQSGDERELVIKRSDRHRGTAPYDSEQRKDLECNIQHPAFRYFLKRFSSCLS